MDEFNGRQSFFGGVRGAAARQAWSASRTRVRLRFGQASLAERAALVLIAALTLGVLLLILIPALLIGALALVLGWGWLTCRRLLRRLRGGPRDQSLRRNVRVIRR
ncbi:MAG: hypothetical protein KDA21_00505 [Phycisphaerales bacterium]|nr:hypothetical protein [Phycisphaerales bacterium]